MGLLFAYLYFNDLLKHFLELEWYWWLVSILLAWVVMVLSSWVMFLAKVGVTPDFRTLIFFPVVQNIAGYLFPIQGSLVFSSLYFKRAHEVDFGTTLSFNLAILLLSVAAVGLCGLVLLINGTEPPSVRYVSLAVFLMMLTCSMSVFVLCYRCSRMKSIGRRSSIDSRLHGFLTQRLLDVRHQVEKFRELPFIILPYFGKVIIYVVWFWFLAQALDSELSVMEVLFLVFAVEASLVFKLVPGNWGVAQASGGVALALVDGPVADGVLVITMSMASVAVLIVCIGSFSVNHMVKRLPGLSFQRLYTELKNSTLGARKD